MSTPQPLLGHPATPLPVHRLRDYAACDSLEAAEILGLSRPAFDARRGRATIWYELGGAGTHVAVGPRPRGRPADALPLVGIAMPYLGVCLPGAEWTYDRYAVRATKDAPLETLALISAGALALADAVVRMRAVLEQRP